MFRHSVSERQHIQRPMNIWLLQEGAGLTVKLLTHWLITNKWHEWDLKCRFSYVWPKMSDDLSSDMFTEVRKTLPDWQVQTFFTVSVLLLFLMFESFSFLFPFFFPRLVSDHFLVISVCLFVALAHVSVCWVCFLSVWFTLGGLCNFFGQCILCLTCFFFCTFWEVSKYTATESSRVRFIQKHVELYFFCLLLNPMKLFTADCKCWIRQLKWIFMCQLKEHQKLNDLLCAACGVDLKWDGKPDVTQYFNA